MVADGHDGFEQAYGTDADPQPMPEDQRLPAPHEQPGAHHKKEPIAPASHGTYHLSWLPCFLHYSSIAPVLQTRLARNSYLAPHPPQLRIKFFIKLCAAYNIDYLFHFPPPPPHVDPFARYLMHLLKHVHGLL